jgi:hypothetical protein
MTAKLSLTGEKSKISHLQWLRHYGAKKNNIHTHIYVIIIIQFNSLLFTC